MAYKEGVSAAFPTQGPAACVESADGDLALGFAEPGGKRGREGVEVAFERLLEVFSTFRGRCPCSERSWSYASAKVRARSEAAAMK